MVSFRRVPSIARTAVAGVVIAALVVAAACGDDDDANGIDLPDITGTPTATETVAPVPTEPPAETPTETPTPTETEPPADQNGDATVSIVEEGDLAPYLVGPDGMTLYIFTNDEPGVSNCTPECLISWPALEIAAAETPVAGDGVTGSLGVIEETGHVTYNDQPLYYYAADLEPGDTNGHEVGDVWFVVEP